MKVDFQSLEESFSTITSNAFATKLAEIEHKKLISEEQELFYLPANFLAWQCTKKETSLSNYPLHEATKGAKWRQYLKQASKYLCFL